MGYDPVELGRKVEKAVCEGLKRRYYRFRADRWYGGIATADCCGCNLRCVFCWSNYPRDNPSKTGKFYEPVEVAKRLTSIADKRGFKQLRISGNEPTLCKNHLLAVLEGIEEKYVFILETNGILIGYDKKYARGLARFNNIHVRVSLKGASPDEFARLTGAKPEGFELQLRALENLLDAGVSCHPACMLSFSSKESVERLIRRLAEIDKALVEEFEPEEVILYPHVIKRLRKAGVTPRRFFTPGNVPPEYV